MLDIRDTKYEMMNVIRYADDAMVNAGSENNLQRRQIMLSKVSYENISK
jgi:hypothetical protein